MTIGEAVSINGNKPFIIKDLLSKAGLPVDLLTVSFPLESVLDANHGGTITIVATGVDFVQAEIEPHPDPSILDVVEREVLKWSTELRRLVFRPEAIVVDNVAKKTTLTLSPSHVYPCALL